MTRASELVVKCVIWETRLVYLPVQDQMVILRGSLETWECFELARSKTGEQGPRKSGWHRLQIKPNTPTRRGKG